MAPSDTTARARRTYGQFCPLATGLDVIGDRWVLLICRELVFGPRRFSQIRRALPGIAPNLLSSRLRQLQQDGILSQTPSGAPYELSEAGLAIRPVLGALARFGARYLDAEAIENLDPGAYPAIEVIRKFIVPWTVLGLLSPLRARIHAPDGSAIDLVLGPGEIGVDPFASEPTDVELWSDIRALGRLRRHGTPLPLTRPDGSDSLRGSDDAIATFVAIFDLQFDEPAADSRLSA